MSNEFSWRDEVRKYANQYDHHGLIGFIEAHGGIDKVQFFSLMNPFTTIVPGLGFGLVDGNNEDWTLCRISEERYKVADRYKITLVPIDPLFSSHSFYQEDFISMMDRGFIVPDYPNEKGEFPRIQHIECAIQLTPGAFVHFNANKIVYGREVD